MNVVLIGMRGTGKSTVAKILSHKLDRDYIEMDAVIVERTKMSIPQIVEKHGWDHFRDLETQLVKELAILEKKIISTGGGVVTKKENIDEFKKNRNVLVLLEASIDTIISRIGNDRNRPSITGKPMREDLEELLRQREELYRMAADERINTDSLSQHEVAARIQNTLKNFL